MNKNNKRFTIDTNLINNVNKLNLSKNEFLLILYFDNEIEPIFNVETISKFLCLSLEEVMTTFSSLLEKKLIKVEVKKNDSNKVVEIINLDGFYENIKEELKKEEEVKKAKDIFKVFEEAFNRELSMLEYEVIKAWIEKGYSEALIDEALKEAIFNGAINIRFVDKILYEWDKKGIKEVSDLKVKEDKKFVATEEEMELLNYNWLDNDY